MVKTYKEINLLNLLPHEIHLSEDIAVNIVNNVNIILLSSIYVTLSVAGIVS